ncbi:hypothetical protein HYALB_00006736 [Hymenoscyphus albidus]|uniref:NTF2-like protein n=1 Tax=Hymenoscyphus albidus TaxID=595503 RepID=A0A9N9LRP0_9HELO|nr:hypothetical protein HYALB_00006736 [Hymenoscyphus albidus]
MTLQTVYQQFLATNDASLLATDASLHYITTLTTVNGAGAIGKHLSGQLYELKKKEEKVLDAVESSNALVVEVHTTIEFLTGGGAYLPGLDDNFLADRTVTFPVIHIVTFDADRKITQVRQNWDQGSLLKLIDVIGKSGRNWPIRDGKDQIKLIVNSTKSAGKTSTGTSHANELPIRPRGNSNNVTGDPHASLALFAPREKYPQADSVIAPKSSSRPPPREYSELFVGGDEDGSPPPKSSSHARSESPSKAYVKSGANKNYAPSRLFDVDTVEEEDVAPLVAEGQSGNRQFYRPNPKRYEHFDMTDGDVEEPVEDKNQKPLKGVASEKHNSQWNFDDFNTPQKVVPTKVLRTNDVRHWGNSDDEVEDSPVKVKKVSKPRKDAEPHFEFVDDGTPAGAKRTINRPRGKGQNDGLGIYKNNLYDDENGGSAGGAAFDKGNTLANVKDRRKDFDPHFAMTDESPVSTPTTERIPDHRAKAVKMMDANWDTYDQSPNQKENIAMSKASKSSSGKAPLSEASNTMSHRNDTHVGIALGGNGMGGKKGTTRQWGFGDESDGETTGGGGIMTAGNGMGGKKGTSRQWGFGDDSEPEETAQASKPSKYKTGRTQGRQSDGETTGGGGIMTAGNGMGGKKGTSRQWGFGDDSEPEETAQVSKPSKYKTGKTQGRQQATGGDFWDF